VESLLVSLASACLLCAVDSASSRIGRLFEISDLTDTEAIDYLRNKRKVSDNHINKIIETVGGRINHLKMVAGRLQKGQGLESLRFQSRS
jgi:hypothetical protein